MILVPLFLLCADSVVSFERHPNSISIQLDDGRAEIQLLSPGSLRVRRDWARNAGAFAPRRPRYVPYKIEHTSAAIHIATTDLAVELQRSPLRISVSEPGGRMYLISAHASRDGNNLKLDFELNESDRLYGWGVNSQPRQDIRADAKPLVSRRAFLWSSGNYGLYFPRDAAYSLTTSPSGKTSVAVDGTATMEFCLYSGGNAKDVFEKHRACESEEFDLLREHVGWLDPATVPSYATPLPKAWPDALRGAIHVSLSAQPAPVFDLLALRNASDSERKRAELVAALMPLVSKPPGYQVPAAAADLRQMFSLHLITYLQEIKDRGFPVIHPLPFQFPSDAAAADAEDQFLLGDELLIAPHIDGQHRKIYLPQGQWTDLETNRIHRGRQTIERLPVSDRPAMFARNGAILPLETPGAVELHYFPKLGGEYFIYELEQGEITQVHASPAGDYLRLEIEERHGRQYEWVIHNIRRPVGIESQGVRFPHHPTSNLPVGAWRYDSVRSNLHVRVRLQAGDSIIVNCAFSEAVWYLLRP